ncbi:hypothetical protein PN417_10060, partial [Halorubrum ezzemoulense]|uniref:hypothetical protein n=1 Tax=Halorubrum ezzemoulense TaxID=337243 RepID=UPI00232E6E15
MIRTRSLRWVSVGIVACLVIVTVALLLGANTVTAQNSDQGVYLNKSGSPDSLRVGKSSQNISNISIILNQADSVQSIKLFVNLTSVKSKGVRTSSASISINSIQNGSVTNTSYLNSDNRSFLTATIRPNKTAHSIQIDSAQISGIATNNASKSEKLTYSVGVTNSSTHPSREKRNVSNTSPFKIIDGTINVPDQATGSPQLHRNTPTTIGITVDNLSGNTNSTLFITRDDENEVIGQRGVSINTFNQKESISVDTAHPGGDVKAFLVANSTLGDSDYSTLEQLPPNMTSSALSTDSGRIVTADVYFHNRSYSSPQRNKIVVSFARVSDTIDEKTPFFVSLHPVNSTGYILKDNIIANSKVLTGWNDNVSLYFNTTTYKCGIFRSNRYAVAIQLARDYSGGDWISPRDSELLRNSDLNEQFVSDGVADGGVISITTVSTNVSCSEGIHIKRNESLNKPVYSGQPICYRSPSDPKSVELHKISKDNTTRVVSVGTRVNNSSYIQYNTSLLSSGTYYIHTNTGNTRKFDIIGREKKDISLNDSPSRVAYADSIKTSCSVERRRRLRIVSLISRDLDAVWRYGTSQDPRTDVSRIR